MRSELAHAFRRVALPLGCYYAVTLGLPLANGAAHAGAAFVGHALAVLVVPPVLIVLLSTMREVAGAVARASRSACASRTAARRPDLATVRIENGDGTTSW